MKFEQLTNSDSKNASGLSLQNRDPLLQPLRIRHVEFRNRIMSTSHACGLQNSEGYPGDVYQAYHTEKAKGGLALSMFGGSSNVAPDSPNVFGQLYVGNDGVIPYLQDFSNKVHDAGAKIMCQITHLGRRGESYADRVLPTIAPSMVRETLHRSFPKAMDKHDIKRVVNEFAEAAWRCKMGGLDGIETLAGAHLIGQFISPVTNHRTDNYGGSLENRCRFGLQVLEAIRKRVGDNFLIGLRFHINEAHAEGLNAEQSLEIAHHFEKAGVLDFFNANYGRMDTYISLAEHNMPGMASPLAPWLALAGDFKQAVSLPVFHAARITDLATARYSIESGLLDMVAMTRAHIADPHLVNKLTAGQEHRIRPCVGATHCMGSSTRPSCLHNPVTGRETVLSQTVRPLKPQELKHRIVIVGGGPAGLEAARIASSRGHQVTLLEAESSLGGQVQLALKASWRQDLSGIVDWRVSELQELNVDIRLNCYADIQQVLNLKPTVVVIATGGIPDTQWIKGEEHITTAWDILSGQVPAAETALVYDGTGRHVAATAAETLLGKGSEVELVSIDDHFGMELVYSEQTVWRKRCYELALPMTFNLRLVSVEQCNNRLKVLFNNELTNEVVCKMTDQLVVEHGTTPADDLYLQLQPLALNEGVTDLDAFVKGSAQPFSNGGDNGFVLYRIGDAVSSRNIHTAILDANRLMASM